jgi:hypothetical protein
VKWWPLVFACACATPRVIEQPAPVAQPPVVVDVKSALSAQFRDAVSARRFDDVLALLSRRWRDRYDPQRLAHDFELEPLAKIRSGMPLKLVQEDGEWKVDSLE